MAWRFLRSIGGIALLTIATTPAHSRPYFLTKYHQFDAQSPIGAKLADLDADGKLDVVALTTSTPGLLVRLGDGEGDFETTTFLPLPSGPFAFEVARVNTDAHLDLVVTHTPGAVSVYYGNGDGTFGPRIEVGVGSLPAAIAVGDLDEDGHNDLVVATQGSNQLWILFGLFDEFWFPIVQVPTELDPAAIALADLNGDDHLDMAVLNQGSNTVTIRTGDGQGAFSAATSHSGYASMRDLAVADLDGDTILDLATSNGVQGSVGVFLGNGDGSLQSPVSWPAGVGPRALAVVDANADTTPDLALTLPDRDTVALLLGTGGGSFAAPSEILAAIAPIDLSTGDLDGDGKAELAVTNSSGVTIHHSNGDGTYGFTPPTYSVGEGDKYVVLRDLDADGKLDLAVARDVDGGLAILWGNGDGTFEPGPVLPTGSQPRGIAVGDINGDGWLDLATADFGPSIVSLFVRSGVRTYAAAGSIAAPPGPQRVALDALDGNAPLDLVVLGLEAVRVHPGLGGGAFGPAVGVGVGPSHDSDAHDLDLADVNLDGKQDVLVSAPACCPSAVWQFLGNGDGTLQPGEALFSGDERPLGLAVGLLDGNSSPDLALLIVGITITQSLPIWIRPGNGDGSYASAPDGGFSINGAWIEMGDLDEHPAQDLIIANSMLPARTPGFFFGQFGNVSIHPGRGDGTFGMRLDFGLDGRPSRLAAGDLNGDGALDLVVGDRISSRVWALLNQRGETTDAGEIVPAGSSTAKLSVRNASGSLRIDYDVGGRATTPVALEIFDVRGRRIRSLQNGVVAPGPRTLTWNGHDDAGTRVARGVYWVNLRTPATKLQRKIVHL